MTAKHKPSGECQPNIQRECKPNIHFPVQLLSACVHVSPSSGADLARLVVLGAIFFGSLSLNRFHLKKEVQGIAVNKTHPRIAPWSLRTKDLILPSFISLKSVVIRKG